MRVKKYYKLVRVDYEDSAYLRLKNVSNESGTFNITKNESWMNKNFKYSLDGVNWTSYDISTSPSITLAPGANIYLKGNNVSTSDGSGSYTNIHFDKNFELHGNICSLLNEDPAVFSQINSITSSYCFLKLFYGNTTLVSVGDIFSTITTVSAERAFNNIFGGCTALQSIDFSNITSVSGINTFNQACGACSNLSNVKSPNVSSWSSSFGNWLLNAGTSVSGTKTIYIPSGLTVGTGTDEIPLNSNNGIPTGWSYDTY